MDLNLKDKVVIVTGGAAGIGRATVDGFAAEGATVVLAARDEDPLLHIEHRAIRHAIIEAERDARSEGRRHRRRLGEKRRR